MKSTRPGTAMLAIGEVADHFGLAPHVLRHWESVGLLAPARAAGRRRYRRNDLYRVAVILRAKQAGFALDDIAAMLTTPDPVRRTAILHRHHDDLTQRIAHAEAALALIDGALTCDHDDIATCPHFQALLTDRVNGTAPRPGSPQPT